MQVSFGVVFFCMAVVGAFVFFIGLLLGNLTLQALLKKKCGVVWVGGEFVWKDTLRPIKRTTEPASRGPLPRA